MSWTIKLYESERREKPVEKFIKSCQPQTIAKILHEIDLLEKYGHFLGMPHSKKLTKDIFELRIRGRQEIRILYGFVKKDIYLVHAFKKQKNKTPPKEIKKAIKKLESLTKS